MKKQAGQSLITLIIFMFMSVVIVSGAVAVILINSKSTTSVYQGNVSYGVAEAGIENALIRLLRDPNYTGETLTVNGGSATITVSGGIVKTITSVGTSGSFKRTIQATVDTSNNKQVVTSWKEI